jgi:hypothetical protein
MPDVRISSQGPISQQAYSGCISPIKQLEITATSNDLHAAFFSVKAQHLGKSGSTRAMVKEYKSSSLFFAFPAKAGYSFAMAPAFAGVLGPLI